MCFSIPRCLICQCDTNHYGFQYFDVVLTAVIITYTIHSSCKPSGSLCRASSNEKFCIHTAVQAIYSRKKRVTCIYTQWHLKSATEKSYLMLCVVISHFILLFLSVFSSLICTSMSRVTYSLQINAIFFLMMLQQPYKKAEDDLNYSLQSVFLLTKYALLLTHPQCFRQRPCLHKFSCADALQIMQKTRWKTLPCTSWAWPSFHPYCCFRLYFVLLN